jgi:hypothetical protein
MRAVTLGLWRPVKLAAVVFGCALILAIGLGAVFFSLQAFFDSYGILGVIGILLGLIVIQLQRLISTGHGRGYPRCQSRVNKPAVTGPAGLFLE